MPKVIADANYVLRWFLNDVPDQSAIVEKLLTTSVDNHIYLDRITIAEITYVLRSKGYDHKQVAVVVAEFCRHTSVNPLPEVDAEALSLYGESSLDFEDCWLATYGKENKVKIATFDKKLLSLSS